jgi:cytochrome c551/c552
LSAADLAKNKACLACHAVDKKVVGPAFKDVAGRYKGRADAEAQPRRKAPQGSTGAWGQIPMPANPDLSSGRPPPHPMGARWSMISGSGTHIPTILSRVY